MKLSLVILSVLFAVAFAASRDRNNKSYRVVCYWGSWSYYRPGEGKFEAEDSNPNICTHMIYGFAKLKEDNTIGIFDDNLDVGATNWDSGLVYGLGMYRRFNNLRQFNPHLTTLLSIGGWNEGSDKYSKMVSSSSSRTTFVNSVVKLLTEHDFDGLDLDWEYPGSQASGDADRKPGNHADVANYVSLLQDLHNAFQPHGFILTAAVSAGKPTIDRGYDVPGVNKYLDFINLMAYDFHGGWENKTAHNAPIHAHPNDVELDKEFTIEYAVDYWIKLGATPNKIVLGMPLYARTFTLKDPANFSIGADAIGSGGPAGPITRLVGMLGYNEVCADLKKGGWKTYRDDVEKVPYAVNGNVWIGYDDEQSLKDKVDFLKSKKLGGAMVWSVDTDDFHGSCGKGKFPLLKSISKALNGVDGPDVDIPRSSTVKPHTTGSDTPVTEPSTKPSTHQTTQPSTKTSTHTTPHTTQSQKTSKHTVKNTDPTDEPITDEPTDAPTKAPDGKFHCTGSGFFADPSDKTVYHECINNGGGNYQDIVYHCGSGQVYDEVHHVCK